MTSFFWNKHFVAITILVCLLLSTTTQAVASEVGIRLTPSVIQIRPQENGVIEKSITIENSGKDPVDLQIDKKVFTTNKKGEIIYPSGDKLSQATKDFVATEVSVLENSIPVNEISLAPGQKQTLLLRIAIKDIQKISQYTFSLFFVSKNSRNEGLSTPEESPIHTELNVAVGSAMHVLIFGKKAHSQGDLTITAFQTERFIQEGPVSFVTQAKNGSEEYINIHGTIAISNMFGQQIGIVRIPTQLLPAGAQREISGPIEQASKQKIDWPEKLLLGNYHAKLTITTDTGAETSEEATFFAFPIRKVLLVLIALLIASFVIGQVREKIQ